MNTIGIDFVALAVIGVAMVIGQIRQVPPAVRYYVMAVAFTIVAVYRLNLGFRDNFNLAIVGLCVVFAINYAVKGLRYRGPSERG